MNLEEVLHDMGRLAKALSQLRVYKLDCQKAQKQEELLELDLDHYLELYKMGAPALAHLMKERKASLQRRRLFKDQQELVDVLLMNLGDTINLHSRLERSIQAVNATLVTHKQRSYRDRVVSFEEFMSGEPCEEFIGHPLELEALYRSECDSEPKDSKEDMEPAGCDMDSSECDEHGDDSSIEWDAEPEDASCSGQEAEGELASVSEAVMTASAVPEDSTLNPENTELGLKEAEVELMELDPMVRLNCARNRIAQIIEEKDLVAQQDP